MNVSNTIVVSTVYGQMLINRYDINQSNTLIKTGKAWDYSKIELIKLLSRTSPPNGVFLDIGANFGCYALAISEEVKNSGGVVHAYEAQREIAYLICGSVALNAMSNVFVHNVCVGNGVTDIDIPKFNYHEPLNFGSVEFKDRQAEQLSQSRGQSTEKVRQIRIDDSNFENVRFMKIDVEGMEEDVLIGATKTIENSNPICLIEYIKSDRNFLVEYFKTRNYRIWDLQGDFLCVSKTNESLSNLNFPEVGI